MVKIKQEDVIFNDITGNYDIIMAAYKKSKLICRTVVSAEPIPNSHTYFMVLNEKRIIIQDSNLEICLDVFNTL